MSWPAVRRNYEGDRELWGWGSPVGAHGSPVSDAGGYIPTGARNQTVGPCAEYSCGDGECITFKQVWAQDGDSVMPWDGDPSSAMRWDTTDVMGWGPQGCPHSCLGPLLRSLLCSPTPCLLEAQCCSMPQVCNGRPDCRDGDVTSGWLPSDEWDCGHWGPWAPWGICSLSCGLGQQLRARECSQRAPGVLRWCHGEATQARPCFSTACPGE